MAQMALTCVTVRQLTFVCVDLPPGSWRRSVVHSETRINCGQGKQIEEHCIQNTRWLATVPNRCSYARGYVTANRPQNRCMYV